MYRDKIRKTGLMLAIAGLSILPSAARAAETVTITVVSGLQGDHDALRIFHHQFRKTLDARLKAAGDAYRIDWQMLAGGLLARRGGVLEAVEDSLGQIGIIEINQENHRLPLHDITFQTPFASTRCEIIAQAYHRLHRTTAALNLSLAEANQRYLANITTDSYGVMSHPKITRQNDLRGLNIIAPDNVSAWFDGFGAQILRVPRIQMKGMLEEARVDAAIVTASEAVLLKLHEAAGKFLAAGLGAQAAFLLTANAAWYDGLPEPLRTALDASAEAFVPAAAKAYCKTGEKALQTMRDAGVGTASLFRTRRQLWADNLPPVAGQWAQAREKAGLPGRAVLAAYLELLQAAGVTPVRNWGE